MRHGVEGDSVCPNPIFIIGSPRSGTTALAYALGQHPDLWYSGETHLFTVLFDPAQMELACTRAAHWLEAQRLTPSELLAWHGMGINALFTHLSGGKRWIEKTPSNTLVVDVLARVFPGASFVHILRDGRSVVHSRTHVHWDDMFQLDFRSACREWRQFAAKAMAFAGEHPDRCLTVRHGQLIQNLDAVFHEIFDFIGAAYHSEPVTFLQSRRINSSFGRTSAGQLSPEVFSNPWKDWSREQKRIFLEEAGAALLAYNVVTEAEMEQLVTDAGDAAMGVSLRALRTEGRTPSLADARMRQSVVNLTPEGAKILVLSRGDEELVELEGRVGLHFPQTAEGIYAGEYPADSQEAIRQLEELRGRGASYLLIPAPAFWWLDYYAGFAEHLHSRYHCLWQDEELILYALEPA